MSFKTAVEHTVGVAATAGLLVGCNPVMPDRSYGFNIPGYPPSELELPYNLCGNNPPEVVVREGSGSNSRVSLPIKDGGTHIHTPPGTEVTVTCPEQHYEGDPVWGLADLEPGHQYALRRGSLIGTPNTIDITRNGIILAQIPENVCGGDPVYVRQLNKMNGTSQETERIPNTPAKKSAFNSTDYPNVKISWSCDQETYYTNNVYRQ